MTELPPIEGLSEDSLREILREVYQVPGENLDDILGNKISEQSHRFDWFIVVHERLAELAVDIRPILRELPEERRHSATALFLTGKFRENREINKLTHLFMVWRTEGPRQSVEVLMNHMDHFEEAFGTPWGGG